MNDLVETTKIGYLGKDRGYFEGLKRALEDYFEAYKTKFKIEILHFHESNPAKHHALVENIFKERIKVLFFDLSSEIDQHLFLLRRLRFMNRGKRIFIQTLSDPLTKGKVLDQVFLGGVAFNHFKGPEYSDLIYDLCHTLFPHNVDEPDYAVADNFEKNYSVTELARVSVYDSKMIHIESNSVFSEGQQVEFKHSMPERCSPSLIFQVNAPEQTNFYYPLKYKYTLTPTFFDNFRIEEKRYIVNDAEEMIFVDELEDGTYPTHDIRIQKEKVDLPVDIVKKGVDKARVEYLDWLGDQVPKSVAKAVKIVILDNEYKFFIGSGIKIKDSHFCFKIHDRYKDVATELLRDFPHIIIVNYEAKKKVASKDDKIEDIQEDKTDAAGQKAVETNNSEEPKTQTPNYNDLNLVKKLIKGIKQIDDYNPFVLIFNLKALSKEDKVVTSKALQTQFSYPNLLAQFDEIDEGIVLSFAAAFEKKFKAPDFSKSYIPEKELDHSLIWIKREITLIYINESEVYFRTESKISMYSVLYLEEPTPLRVTVVPHLPNSPYSQDPTVFKGLIHSVNEDQKKELRRFVNSILGTEKTAKHEKDKIDLVQKNLKFKEKEKEAEEKKLAEEKAKAEAEKAKEEEKQPKKEEAPVQEETPKNDKPSDTEQSDQAPLNIESEKNTEGTNATSQGGTDKVNNTLAKKNQKQKKLDVDD